MKYIVMCLLLLTSVTASAQPFGIIMGQRVDDLQIVRPVREFRYSITPSKKHIEMQSYIVTATPKQGVCMVSGIGVDHDGDAYGDKIKRVAGELRTQVETTYGPAKLFDHLNSGSIWKESNYWTMGVLKNERSYQLSCENSSYNKLPNDVIEILETVNATDNESSYVTLQFKFKNFAACKAGMDGTAAKVF